MIGPKECRLRIEIVSLITFLWASRNAPQCHRLGFTWTQLNNSSCSYIWYGRHNGQWSLSWTVVVWLPPVEYKISFWRVLPGPMPKVSLLMMKEKPRLHWIFCWSRVEVPRMTSRNRWSRLFGYHFTLVVPTLTQSKLCCNCWLSGRDASNSQGAHGKEYPNARRGFTLNHILTLFFSRIREYLIHASTSL
jgi:hypothetical protein